MTMDATGSTHSASNASTPTPAAMAASEPAASAVMWRNAPLRLRSRWCPLARASSTAQNPLTASAAVATSTTPSPSMVWGSSKRRIASTKIQAAAASRSTAFTCAPSASARRSP